MGYRPWGHEEMGLSNTHTHTHTHTHIHMLDIGYAVVRKQTRYPPLGASYPNEKSQVNRCCLDCLLDALQVLQGTNNDSNRENHL